MSFRYEDDEYPETSGLTPWEIAWFINDHPQANLSRLWKRLGIKTDPDFAPDLFACSACKAEMLDYDLDNEPGDEVLLRVSDLGPESFRYMIFKSVDRGEHWSLLGYVDAGGKYREAQHVILLSDGKAFLQITGQSASGSGVSAYNSRLFEVTKHGLKELLSYCNEGFNAGYDGWPSKGFSGQVLSCEKVEGQTKVTVEFEADYIVWTAANVDTPLFTKRQTAVFIRRSRGIAVLDPTQSTISKRELDHIYNIDSMTGSDFLKYNYSELLNLANRGNSAQKRWLKNYLEMCDNGVEKRRLFAALLK